MDNDRPIEKTTDDDWGYAFFASNLSKAIMSLNSESGFVIALNGEWGDGKTSILNMTEEKINTSQKKASFPTGGYTGWINIHPENYCIVLRFDPWLFTARDDIVTNLIHQIATVLDQHLLYPVTDILNNLLAVISSEESFGCWSKIAKVVKAFSKPKLTVQKLKNKIGDTLAEKKIKLVIFIDDIDRLTTEETFELFRAVKAVANFKNTIYVLAFDEKIVKKRLQNYIEDSQGETKQDTHYIEKIVQVSFPVPKRSLWDLKVNFINRINAIIKDESRALEKDERFSSFDCLFNSVLTTQRAVIRLCNSFELTYSLTPNEVNVLDFLVIETLRVFSSDVYKIISENQELLCHGISGFDRLLAGGTQPENHSLYRQLNKLLSNLFSEEEATLLLKTLFPIFYGYTISTYNQIPTPDLRICHYDKFPLYFKLKLGEEISNNIIEQMLKDAEQKRISKICEVLIQHKNEKFITKNERKICQLINLIERKKIETETVKSVLINSFLELGDNFLSDLSDNEKQELYNSINSLFTSFEPYADEPCTLTEEVISLFCRFLSEGNCFYLIFDYIYPRKLRCERIKTALHNEISKRLKNNECFESYYFTKFLNFMGFQKKGLLSNYTKRILKKEETKKMLDAILNSIVMIPENQTRTDILTLLREISKNKNYKTKVRKKIIQHITPK